MTRAPDFPAVSPGRLLSLAETSALIATGRFLSIAADESLLRQLPRGNWMGGTIPYFMAQDGGEASREKLFVTPVPDFARSVRLAFYDIFNIQDVCADSPANGYSLIIIPAFSDLHSLFARQAPAFKDMFMKPLAGWIAGCHLDDLGKVLPRAVLGTEGVFDSARAVVMHVELPPERWARLDIRNPFRQGDGDILLFPETGFSTKECFLNGAPANFADYLIRRGIDIRLPLVADYGGALVNVSIERVNRERRTVEFYAPVFNDTEYRIAAPLPDHISAFEGGGGEAPVAFCCNCILNYLHCGLEGRSTGGMLGPMTFGEVAYQLLNQTMVYLTIEG